MLSLAMFDESVRAAAMAVAIHLTCSITSHILSVHDVKAMKGAMATAHERRRNNDAPVHSAHSGAIASSQLWTHNLQVLLIKSCVLQAF